MGLITKSRVIFQTIGANPFFGSGNTVAEPVHEKAISVYPKSEKTVEVDGRMVSYTEAGNPRNPTIVLVHGIASGKKVWSESIDGTRRSESDPIATSAVKALHRKQYRKHITPLSEKFHVIAPDLPGFGGSEKPKRVTHEYLEGRFMPEFTKRLEIDKMHLVGISMGGAVALGYSIRNPETVESLHLMCPFGLESYGLGPIAMLALRNTKISKTGISIANSEKLGKHITKLYSFLGELGHRPNNNMKSIISYMAAMDDSSLEWLSDQVQNPIF